MNVAAFIREMCRGSQTRVLTAGARLGSDWLERLETGLPDETGEGVGVDRGAGKLPARVQNVKLLNIQSINGL